MTRRHASLLTNLLLGLIALLGFHACSTPEEIIVTDPSDPRDSICDIRVMYGGPTRSYQESRGEAFSQPSPKGNGALTHSKRNTLNKKS